MTTQAKSQTASCQDSQDWLKAATVAVIIPTYNQARFLAESINSVLAQTHAADEIIVVDDGSTDDPGSVVAKFPKIQFIRQINRGPSAARNTGLRSSKARHLVFLDADDRLLPTAIEAGLACMADRPDCAFVYGGHRHISEDGRPISPDCILHIEGDPHLALIRRNLIVMHATVLYRRDCLSTVNGFDDSLRRAEDYDLYLRLAQRYPIASHSEIVAEYRKHGKNASDDHVEQLRVALDMLRRHEARIASNPTVRAAFRRGRAGVTKFRVSAMLADAGARWNNSHDVIALMHDVLQAAQWSPSVVIRKLLGASRRRMMGWVDRDLYIHLSDSALTRLRFKRFHGYVPSLKDPKTFSEWINRRKLFDRNPLLTLTTDKLAVRDYVRQRCGESILIPLLDAVDSVEALNLDRLPDRFVLKPTHASGLVEIVKDRALIDKNELLIRLNAWLKLDFYAVHREWAYKNIPRRIVVEEALLDVKDQPPHDYKFYVFRGAVQMIHVDVGRFSTHLRSLFDRNWNLLNVTYQYPYAGDQPKPLKLDEMIAIAEALGRDFEFARIDLYVHDGRIYFGEITHTPEAGFAVFNPRDFDRSLGELLSGGTRIPIRYVADRQLVETPRVSGKPTDQLP